MKSSEITVQEEKIQIPRWFVWLFPNIQYILPFGCNTAPGTYTLISSSDWT